MVALDAEIPFRRSAEFWILLRAELAGLDSGIPGGCADIVRRDFLAIQPVLDVVSLRDDAGVVPFVRRAGSALGGGEQIVDRSGEVIVLFVVGRVRVIEQLVLRCA